MALYRLKENQDKIVDAFLVKAPVDERGFLQSPSSDFGKWMSQWNGYQATCMRKGDHLQDRGPYYLVIISNSLTQPKTKWEIPMNESFYLMKLISGFDNNIMERVFDTMMVRDFESSTELVPAANNCHAVITLLQKEWINKQPKDYTDKERYDLERFGPWYYQVINVQHEYVKEKAMLPGLVFCEATEIKTGQPVHIDITEEVIRYLGFRTYSTVETTWSSLSGLEHRECVLDPSPTCFRLFG